MEAWSGISLTIGTATGNLKQLYPTWGTVGVDPATATNGQLIRQAIEGQLQSVQVETDGVNGFVLQIWDLNGADVGANVSSLDVITNAQLIAAQARGLAKLIYEQNIIASGLTPVGASFRPMQRGLAARAYSDDPAGTAKLNLVLDGGFRLVPKVG